MRDRETGGRSGPARHGREILSRMRRAFQGAGPNSASAPAPRGFLGRLLRDARGNTLAIIGAALVPLAGMIGSGVDMSRAYMAKTRLQSACDAAALAGRRVMQNDTLTASVTNEANRFFAFNFPQRLYNTATFAPTVTRPAAGTVRVTASTTIPTSVMKLFGFVSLPLSVTCDASLNFVNTDVMLVLDTTGSMANDVNDNPTTPSNSKIQALRDAAMALYDTLAPTQTQLEAAGMRLRYGIVPYSSSVNVGALIRAANASYLVDSYNYQSRVANYTTLSSYVVTGTSTAQTPETYGSLLSSSSCNTYGANKSYPTLDGAGPFTISGTQASGTVVTRTYSFRDWGATGTTTGTNRTCRRWYTDTTTTYAPRYSYTDDTYRQVSFDTSQYKLGNPVTLASNDGGTVGTSGSYSSEALVGAGTGMGTTTSSWNGCIEERDTTSTITSSSGYSIPSSAFDLDINRIPTNDATRWRPMWPDVVHQRSAGSTTATSGTAMSSLSNSYYACPTAAQRLTAWTRANLLSYVNSLSPLGGTYHDIGMIWGARMLSSGGIFADSPDTYNGMPVSRSIIFMTDGQLAPNCNSYSAYGVEQNDMRVTGAGSCPNQYDRHLQRFRMICNAAKGMNMSIWVIALGTTLSQDMIDCASNANQASTSADRATLIARFQQIGSQIGALRLTQ